MKKFTKRLVTGIVLFTIVASATFVGNLGYQKYVNWRFGDYVYDYSKQVERRAAYAAYKLAKPHLDFEQQTTYERRLTKLEDDFQHPLRTAVHNLTAPDFLDKDTDSFDEVLTDLSFAFRREESPGKEIWDLCRAQGEVSCIAWPFMLEDLGFTKADGSSAISYEEYLVWKARFEPAKKRMDNLLAMHE